MMAAALRILLYSATPRAHPGGVQSVVERLLGFLRARGHAVFESWASPGPAESGEAWVQPLRLRDRSKGLLGPISALGGLHAGLRRRRPDIVNIHFVTGQSLYFLLLSRVLGYVTVLSAHGSDIMRPADGARRLLPFVLRHADAITVVSEDLRRRVLALAGVDPARVHVIANGVDYDFWSALPRQRATPPRIVAVGRLEPVKGFDVLLAAFAQIARAAPEAQLILAGAGSEAEALRERARALGVADRVKLVGQQPPHAIRALLAEASAFVLSSRSEGMPLVLLEAMAAGAPIISTDVGAAAEMLGDAGLTCPAGESEPLAERLIRLLRDPDHGEQLGRAAQARARAYSLDISQAAYETLYAQLLAERGRTPNKERAA